MSGAEPGAKPSLGPGLKWAVVGALLLGAFAVLYVIGGSIIKPAPAAGGLDGLAHGEMAKLRVPDAPRSYPPIKLVDADGKPVQLAGLKGKVVVMNLWATWCAPCKVEMPTLAALQKAYAARPVKVVAISADTPGQTAQAKAFIAEHPPLAFYQDPQMSFMSAVKPPPQGLPLTMIFDKSGMQRAVLAGEANWSSPEAHGVIDRLLGS